MKHEVPPICCLALALLFLSRSHAAEGPKRQAVSQATMRVAAAADLRFAMDDLVAQFRREHSEIVVEVTYGSSGNFFSQLTAHAPFDLFFSADAALPEKLAARGYALEGSEFLYAVGHIVLWVSSSSRLDVAREGIEVLRNPSVKHVAIANPRHAPYGQAAEAALKSLGVYDDVKAKLVYGENVAQAAQFVESGAAEAGLIASSLAVTPTMEREGKRWEVPLDAYPRMNQKGVILKWASDPEAAKTFCAFVLDSDGRATLKRHGFLLPGE